MFVNQNTSAKAGPSNAKRWQASQMGLGDMVLFPRFLRHDVPRNDGDRRITVTSNAVPERLDSWGYRIGFT